jgi:chemotaxis protein methyltransferase CheR
MEADGGGSETEAIEIRLLLEAIRARYGYDLRDYAPASMRRRVLTALARSGLENLGQLQHQILDDPQLFGSVLEDLTVRVSDMFRDPDFYRAFRDEITPVLRTYPRLNIWHSGCATGEEAYSTAILLTEAGLYDRAQIYATDLSPRALEQAKEGVYSAEHLAAYTTNYEKTGGTSRLSSYYTAAYDRIAIREALRRNILFFQHDLVADHVFAEMNVIFCRNVLIYFGQELRQRVLHKFTQSLCPGGFLCLGSSEQLSRSGADTDAQMFVPFGARAKDRIYRRHLPSRPAEV